MDMQRGPVEQLEIEFPPTPRERLAKRQRPWGLRQLADVIGIHAKTIYQHRDEGLLEVRLASPAGRKRPTYKVEPAKALAYYDLVHKEYDPLEF
jgi:hypothetical protein